MNVVISIYGRFHAFYLAEQLQKRGQLKALITSYPKFETSKYRVAAEGVRSLFPYEIVRRVLRRIPPRLRPASVNELMLAKVFDRHVASMLSRDVDVFIGWSGGSLHSIRRARKLGIPTVVVRGSTHIEFQRRIMEEEYARWGIKIAPVDPEVVARELQEYEETDYIYNQRDFVRRTFMDAGVPAKKLFVVHPGVDASNFVRLEKQDDVFRVIFCGALSFRKGLPYLLHAFCELDLPNSELWLIGGATGETAQLLRQYSSPRVHLKGTVKENRLKELYSQGSVMCCPSIEEGLAMVQAQGMACELPLICTENAGGDVFVREGVDGFVVPIRDVDALKARILTLYEDQERCREMGREARWRIVDRFTWDHYGDGISRALSRIAAGEPPQ
ncbi:MAG: glycosyltransferase family 4 protein [Gemmatimonas sp.]